MTPTEQDKELRRNICGIATGVLWGKNFDELTPNERSRVNAMAKDLEAYITADRKRVALEARIETVTYIDGMLRFENIPLHPVQAESLKQYLRQLKAQQEEV